MKRECDTAITAWKAQYDFACPATQPTFEDWTLYYNFDDILSLEWTAGNKREQA